MLEKLKPSIAWVLILLVWIATPFVGDRVPAPLVWAYVALTILSVAYGLLAGVAHKRFALILVAFLTAFAWSILLMVFLRLFGIN